MKMRRLYSGFPILAIAIASAGTLISAGPLLAQQPQAPAPSTKPAEPSAPAAKPAQPSPADDNAFPEAASEAAAKQAAAQQNADEKASGSGSAVSDEKAGSSSRDSLAGLDLLGDNQSRISNGAGGTIVDPKLSSQDLKVGQQYMGMGNYPGAYDRFKEACTVNPGNVEAVFYLAEAARKTAHLDESAQNYRLYLQVQPDGSKAKAARKALSQLAGK